MTDGVGTACGRPASALLQEGLGSEELIFKKGARELNMPSSTTHLAEQAAESWGFKNPLNHLCLFGLVQECGGHNRTYPLTNAIKAPRHPAPQILMRQQTKGSWR